MRVVEASAFVAAPLGGMTLAQLGADVIRIDNKTAANTETIPVMSEKQTLAQQTAGRIDFALQNVIKEDANIEDNRGKFF